MPLDIDEMRKVAKQRPGEPKSKGKSRPQGRPPGYETINVSTPDTANMNKQKRALIEQLFDENKDINLEEIIKQELLSSNSGDKKVGKTVSSLKGVRETLEDILNIDQLSDLITGFRRKRKDAGNKEEEQQEDSGQAASNFMGMLPFLQSMQNGGFDTSQINPWMLSMAMASQKSSQNNLGMLFFMLSMANLLQNQNRTQGNGNNTPNINADIIKSVYTELQKYMQQPQQPALDPTTMLLFKLITNERQGNTQDTSVQLILDKMTQVMSNNQTQQLTYIMQQSNEKFEKIAEMFASAMHRDPEEKMYKHFQLYRDMQGDSRQLTKDEMDYRLRAKELTLRENARTDLLDREERDKIREDQKSDRIVNVAEKVIDTVTGGEGIAQIVGSVMGARANNQMKKQLQRKKVSTEFDPSLLDEM